MTGQSYTDADVDLVAGWFRRWLGASTIRQRDRRHATEILDALVTAGRLTPVPTTVTAECDIDWTDLRSSRPGADVQARSYEWPLDQFDTLLAAEIRAAELFHRAPVRIRKRTVKAYADGSKLVRAWVRVELPSDV